MLIPGAGSGDLLWYSCSTGAVEGNSGTNLPSGLASPNLTSPQDRTVHPLQHRLILRPIAFPFPVLEKKHKAPQQLRRFTLVNGE